MKRRPPNPAAGTVPCPIPGCSCTAEVRQFAQRAQTDAGKRKAGKFYIDCPEHGRLGFDGAKWIQEHVLEKITWAKDAAPPDASHETRAAAQGAGPQGSARTPATGRAAPPSRPQGKAASASDPPKKKSWLDYL